MSDNKTKMTIDKPRIFFDKLPPGAVLSDQVDRQAYAVAMSEEVKQLKFKLMAANLKIASLEKVIDDA